MNDSELHTNAVEEMLSLLKSGVCIIFRGASKNHPHSYLAGSEFRHNTRREDKDGERLLKALKRSVGKMLTRTVCHD